MIFFLAGVSLGLTTDKLYQYIVKNPNHPEEAESSQTTANAGKAEDGHDDLSQIKGVGPKLAGALDGIGIYNYGQLSSSSVDGLFEQLRAAGGKFNKSTIAAIVERAQLAANEK